MAMQGVASHPIDQRFTVTGLTNGRSVGRRWQSKSKGGNSLGIAAAAFFLTSLCPARHRARHRGPRCRRCAVQFLVGPEAETEGPSDVKLGKLLSWARQQDFMKLHPCLSFGKSGGLQLSVPVSAGTPILGVLDDAFLTSSDLPEQWQEVWDGARERYPEWWALHLGITLLKERRDPSSDAWEAYQNSLAPQPAAPLLWSAAQAQELQYVPMKKQLRSRIEAIQEFYQEILVPVLGEAPGLPSVFELAQAVATARRAIEVSPGQRALLPLLDMVGSPEATVPAGKPTPEANCELQVEPEGGPGGRAIAILVAKRDVQPGETLSRAILGLAPDEVLLEHGWCSTRPDDVTIHVGLKKAVVESWQLATLREVMDLEPGDSPGDWMASAKVRRSSVLTQAVDAKLIAAARVLSAKSREEVLGAEWNLMTKDEILNAGFEGLSSTRRRRLLFVLKRAVEGALAAYDTTIIRDQEILEYLQGRERVAVAYRLGKKMILQDVQAQLERADEKIRQKQAKREKDSALPSAVTGKRKSPTPGKGFG